MQQNQNQFVYNFENQFKDRQNRPIQAFTLVDDIVANVTPDNFGTGFEDVLKEYGGAIIITFKDANSEDVRNALRTYGNWSNDALNGNISNVEHVVEWIYYTRKDNNFSNAFKFESTIKGQLLVISGVFPDIYTDVRRLFNENLIIAEKQHPLIMIHIVNILLQYTLLGINTIKNDIVETLKKTRNLVLINSCQFDLYFNSRKRLVEKQKNILSSVLRVLSILETNTDLLGTRITVRDTIREMKSNVIRYETNMGFMDGQLKDIQDKISDNLDKFFSSVRWFVVILIGVITYMVAGIYSYPMDSNNIDKKKNAVIGRCIGGPITIIIAFLLVKYLGGWKIKWKKY